MTTTEYSIVNQNSRNGSQQCETLEVVCICGGYGYPCGTASAARITMVGRTLQKAGHRFHLLHCGPSPVDSNHASKGIHEGIVFEYLTPVRRPKTRVMRFLIYAFGLFRLAGKLIQLRPKWQNTLVYMYAMDGILNLFTARFCRLLDLPIVQELCEWPPGEPSCSFFRRWLYRSAIFKQATGALVISKEIEQRVRKICTHIHPGLLVHRLPAIFDFQKYPAGTSSENPSKTPPKFVYCGTWSRDVFFLIRAFARLRQQHQTGTLVLIGAYNTLTKREIYKEASAQGLLSEHIEFAGHVDEFTLHALYRSAFALLMPLPDDDRSMTRLPNKMGEYLASGRPVITCRIGDLREILTDGVSAYIAEPGNIESFAEKMLSALRNPFKADQIGAAGRAEGIRYLDYPIHAFSLSQFFSDCSDWHKELRLRRNELMFRKRCWRVTRNFVFLLAALVLRITGQVHHARKRIFRSGSITAIYFHKPNLRLFRRCIRWLQTHEYTFISAEDLILFLYGQKTVSKGSVWLSFDDGYKEILNGVLPLAHSELLPLTLFLPSGVVEGNGLLPWVQHAKREWGDINHLVDALLARDALGVDGLKHISRFPEVTLGSHTAFHLRVNELPEEQFVSELLRSKHSLELYNSGPVTFFSYPESRYSGHEKDILSRAGYLIAVTDNNEFINHATDPFYVPRLCVPDRISYSEAICRMVGIWPSVVKPLKSLISGCARLSRKRVVIAETQSPVR